MDYPRYSILEMHLGKFPDSMEFLSWKVNFKTEVCSKTADPYLTMQWIKEVETAKSIGELMTSRSIVGRKDFPDYDMLDAMIASALKKLITNNDLMNNDSWMTEAKKYEEWKKKEVYEKTAAHFPDRRAKRHRECFALTHPTQVVLDRGPAWRDRATPLCLYFLTYVFHDMTWDELEVSYKGPITCMVVDSAENLMIENTTDELNRTVDMFAVDEYPDETDKENLLVMLSAKIMDNGGHTLSDWMTEALDESTHEKQYDINTGAYHENKTMKDSPMDMTDDISDDQMDKINFTHMAPADH